MRQNIAMNDPEVIRQNLLKPNPLLRQAKRPTPVIVLPPTPPPKPNPIFSSISLSHISPPTKPSAPIRVKNPRKSRSKSLPVKRISSEPSRILVDESTVDGVTESLWVTTTIPDMLKEIEIGVPVAEIVTENGEKFLVTKTLMRKEKRSSSSSLTLARRLEEEISLKKRFALFTPPRMQTLPIVREPLHHLQRHISSKQGSGLRLNSLIYGSGLLRRDTRAYISAVAGRENRRRRFNFVREGLPGPLNFLSDFQVMLQELKTKLHKQHLT